MIRFVERDILKECEYTFKLLVIGSEYVGKTMFIKGISRNMTSDLDTYISTIGVDFNSHVYTLYDKDDRNTHNLKVHIWDTSGQKRFYPITQKYYTNCEGVLVFFDLTKRDSYLHSLSLLEELKIRVKENIKIFLIGSKRDLAYPGLYGNKKDNLYNSLEIKCQVSDYEIREASKKYNFEYFQYSVFNLYSVNIEGNNSILSSNDIIKKMVSSLYLKHRNRIKQDVTDKSLISFFNSFWFYNVERENEETSKEIEIPHNKNDSEIIELQFIKQPRKLYCTIL